MDREEIRYLLGSTIYARAKAYENRVQDLECETAENGVRHLSADVRGSGRNLYRTQAWLRQNGSFVSASCTCPFNENGEGPCCKHIGALLLHEVDEPEEKRESKPEKKALLDIPGVQRGTEFAKEAAARKDSYVSGLEMLFGRKWRGDEPVSDVRAQELLRAYQEDALSEVESLTASDGQQRGFAELEPELILDYSGQPPLLRLRISDGGRQYVVKSIPELLTAIEKERSVSYGKTLAFVHRWDAFTSEAQKILTLLRRQQDTVKSVEAATGRPARSIANGPAGSVPLSGELLDELVALYEPRGEVGGYALRKGLPALTLRVEKNGLAFGIGVISDTAFLKYSLGIERPARINFFSISETSCSGSISFKSIYPVVGKTPSISVSSKRTGNIYSLFSSNALACIAFISTFLVHNFFLYASDINTTENKALLR